jgi:putative transposase
MMRPLTVRMERGISKKKLPLEMWILTHHVIVTGDLNTRYFANDIRTLGGLDRQIIALYDRGVSYNDIRGHHGYVWPGSLYCHYFRITDKILPLIKEWLVVHWSRCILVWLDAIHYKVLHKGRVVSRTVYCIIRLTQEGYKKLLGMYIGENELAKLGLQALIDLQNRGLGDIFIACIDNLQGFADAIESLFPQTEVKLCIVHQIRNSQKDLL